MEITNGVPGTYTINYTHPNGFPLSATCLPQPGSFDATGSDGGPSDNGPTGDGEVTFGVDTLMGQSILSDTTCSLNPFYLSFDLEAGDPLVNLFLSEAMYVKIKTIVKLLIPLTQD